ncbi:MAG: hypothetical protein JO112_15245, partial [Planctomycetes bacterium]|nr:hypothetical protein [Planctomycetota bacterium]
MNFKTTYILFGVLLAVLGVFLLTQLLGKKTTEETGYVLPSLHEDNDALKTSDITGVEIET